ncbi:MULTISPECIES: ribose-5-phosphate isomerase RpiA [Bifidobacterium]|uniref:Ribose-5-phosphate isomerase A n=2 Tax=Bifidobacterium coryneforme TaxID=1687 RepID=A0A087VVP4_9BIFI|nr:MULTISPECIES: ribose-5-phosphate isomerase RpiA [Bifidobacterium]MCT6878021.1 ribose-5-phosphate isomerase RpiA [Bifidobacteriales bacterium]AIC92313.1 ribose 5-phosphate isomerase A [Bifidobacterium indicum LMG 11587 = DSM 20214]KJY53720.1 Ribose-5-phosphate isomerase A [Bifidobacterium coryneforme]MBH9978413.1 ribose-5-phosphate isomerase RpiA [Bifidobacterium sp. W8108]MBI0173717.1 ribose-5-phosphate isomerase RpiA [Bifidobacterium sp. M0307]
MDKTEQDRLKMAAGIEAAKLVENDMIVGLGTGSTVRFFVDELGRRVQEEGLTFTGVTTSLRTKEQAEGYGINIVDVDDVDHIDITIDGADEVDKNFDGIKGGGAALLWEKIVATNSSKIVWIVDESKVVDTIGRFPLPVEVIPFGERHVLDRFKERGYEPVLRLDDQGQPVLTDEHNHVIDLHMEKIEHPEDLAQDLITTVGVVEHGLFLNMVDTVIVGDPNGPRVMTNSNK